MEKLGLNDIRELFLSFYQSKDHYRRQSFSLIPEKDKSLLLINSGMAPLKPYFAGLETPPSKRMTTCQKCIRTGDIENVGYTSRHGTFFEMLGSFSFGDYFEKESLTWGWEFITQVLKMPTDRLWATVYEDDDEAYGIWKDIIGIPEERIVRLGKDDNFWEIGTVRAAHVPRYILTGVNSMDAMILTASRAVIATDTWNSGITCSLSSTEMRREIIQIWLIQISTQAWG